jgi:hypothetical protein
MNWGYKLIVVFALFALLIGTLVYKSMHTKFELVTKDYYKDELKYQDRIDAKNAAAKMSDVSIVQENDSIKIQFPKEIASNISQGNVWFYCKTDEVKDKHINFNNAFAITKNQLNKAYYQAKISYQAGGINYYSEKEILIH